MSTENYQLPYPAENGSVRVPRDIQALATAVDDALKTESSNLKTDLLKQKYFLSVIDFGATGDGVADDADAFQRLAAHCDENHIPYLYIPTTDQNYLLTTPMTLKEPGLKIFGHKGASYDRGLTKNGFLLIGGEAPYGIDLGDFQRSLVQGGSSNNPADTWAVSGLGFKQASGTVPFSKKGVALTSQHNGPDRGVWFNEVSMVGLETGVYIPPNEEDVTIQVANLNIENSVLSSNKYGVLNEGQVYGFSFIKNQSEHNIEHAVKGSFNGGIVISDNMLEGQKDAICITESLGEVKIVSERNYFERNDLNESSYVYMLGNKYYFNENSAKIGPNFTSGVELPPDVIRLTGHGKWKFEIHDKHPLTLYETSASLIKGSRLFDSHDYYRLRSLKFTPTTVVYVDDGFNRIDVDGTHTHIQFTSTNGTLKQTPYGAKYVRSAFDGISIPVSVTQGELVVMNFMLRVKKNNYNAPGKTLQINNVNDVYVANGYPSGLMECSTGDWVLVSIPYHCQGNLSDGFKFKLERDLNEEVDVLGVAVKNYGYFANDTLSTINITPVRPNL